MAGAAFSARFGGGETVLAFLLAGASTAPAAASAPLGAAGTPGGSFWQAPKSCKQPEPEALSSKPVQCTQQLGFLDLGAERPAMLAAGQELESREAPVLS